jgi:hypothetical protein
LIVDMVDKNALWFFSLALIFSILGF